MFDATVEIDLPDVPVLHKTESKEPPAKGTTVGWLEVIDALKKLRLPDNLKRKQIKDFDLDTHVDRLIELVSMVHGRLPSSRPALEAERTKIEEAAKIVRKWRAGTITPRSPREVEQLKRMAASKLAQARHKQVLEQRAKQAEAARRERAAERAEEKAEAKAAWEAGWRFDVEWHRLAKAKRAKYAEALQAKAILDERKRLEQLALERGEELRTAGKIAPFKWTTPREHEMVREAIDRRHAAEEQAVNERIAEIDREVGPGMRRYMAEKIRREVRESVEWSKRVAVEEARREEAKNIRLLEEAMREMKKPLPTGRRIIVPLPEVQRRVLKLKQDIQAARDAEKGVVAVPVAPQTVEVEIPAEVVDKHEMTLRRAAARAAKARAARATKEAASVAVKTGQGEGETDGFTGLGGMFTR